MISASGKPRFSNFKAVSISMLKRAFALVRTGTIGNDRTYYNGVSLHSASQIIIVVNKGTKTSKFMKINYIGLKNLK